MDTSFFLSAGYWNNLYREGDTGWDAGSVTTPLKEYFDTLSDTSLRILLPGCGNGYEAEYLFLKGFREVYVVDFSPIAVSNFKDRVKGFPPENVFCENFFDHTGSYDLIVEQTFFCALHPSLRKSYAEKMGAMLNPNGRLAGLLFTHTLNTNNEPPFGGSDEEYKALFSPLFTIERWEPALNSIKPRAGRELFFCLRKKYAV